MKIRPINNFLKTILGKNIIGITLCPFGIYIRNFNVNSLDIEPMSIKYTINHEKIHWQQQIELIILPFYILYGLEYLIKLIMYGKDAYRNLSFEREAYTNENNLNYLKTRKHYAWIKYIIK